MMLAILPHDFCGGASIAEGWPRCGAASARGLGPALTVLKKSWNVSYIVSYMLVMLVMEKPLCRLCKCRHWSSEAHGGEMGEVVSRPAVLPAEKKEKDGAGIRTVTQTATVTVTDTPTPLSAVERVILWRKKNRERYNEYQRELMRGRRGETS